MRTVMTASLVLAVVAVAHAESGWGPYHDRADQSAAIKKMSPDEEARAGAWALAHPEAARRLRGMIGRDPQRQIMDQFDELSPEERDELGNQLDFQVK